MSDKPPFVPGMTPQEIWQTEQHWNDSQSAQSTANRALSLAQSIGGGSSVSTAVTTTTTAAAAALSDASPNAETAGAVGSAGSSALASRSDHVHALPASLPVVVQVAGAAIGTRATINFVSGATAADNAVTGAVDVTVSGGGGSSSPGSILYLFNNFS